MSACYQQRRHGPLRAAILRLFAGFPAACTLVAGSSAWLALVRDGDTCMAEGMFTKVAAIASALGVSAACLALAAAVHWQPPGASGSSVTGGTGQQLAAYTTITPGRTQPTGGVAVSGRFGHAPYVRFPASNPPGGLERVR